MYIKFCRSFEGDRKDGAKPSSDSKLCVELEGDKGTSELFFYFGTGIMVCGVVFTVLISLTGKPTAEGNNRLYKAACGILTVICVILLLVIVALCVKREYLQP